MEPKVIDISLVSMVFCFLLLLGPVFLFLWLKLKLVKDLLWASLRMAVQLSLVGFYLKYLFIYDNAFVNLTWLFVMILFATYQAVKSSKISRIFLLPILASYIVTIYTLTLLFNFLVLSLDKVFTAKYFIVVGGIILGNSLRGVIISVSSFYKGVYEGRESVEYRLTMLNSLFDALLPQLRKSLELSISPILATMATMGIVSIPGVMTGQILGGASPIVAVKYQMAIVIFVFVAMNLAVILSLVLSFRFAFDEGGRLKEGLIKNKGGA